MRSIYCGQVTSSHVEQTVTLCGWVHRRRDHGGVIFLDIRDREGLAQVVFDPDRAETFAKADRVVKLQLVNQRLEPAHFARLFERMLGDTGIEHMLRSWVYLDNHDTPRLATVLPDERQRRLAQLLMFTLPGATSPPKSGCSRRVPPLLMNAM